MELPGESHEGWGRLLAAVLGDDVADHVDECQGNDRDDRHHDAKPARVLDLRSMYAEAGSIAGDSFVTPTEPLSIPGRERSGSV